jgi:hypothetical protein
MSASKGPIVIPIEEIDGFSTYFQSLIDAHPRVSITADRVKLMWSQLSMDDKILWNKRALEPVIPEEEKGGFEFYLKVNQKLKPKDSIDVDTAKDMWLKSTKEQKKFWVDLVNDMKTPSVPAPAPAPIPTPVPTPVPARIPQLLGQGTYGCVYRPPLKCQDESHYDEKYVNDVMKVAKEHEIDGELAVSAIVRALDPKGQYFLPLRDEFCPIDTTELVKSGCKLKISPRLKGYFSPYGGPTLEKYMEKSVPEITTLWSWIIHLFEGLNLLHKNHVVHMDIKNANIVIDHNIPKLIDFGISFHTYQYDDISFTGYYRLHPLFYSSLGAEDLDIVRIDYDMYIKRFCPDYVKGSKTDPVHTLHALVDRSYKNYIKRIIYPNINKVDVFMLCKEVEDGIIYPYRDYYKKADPKLYQLLRTFLDHGLNIDYNAQYDDVQMLQFIDQHNIRQLI